MLQGFLMPRMGNEDVIEQTVLVLAEPHNFRNTGIKVQFIFNLCFKCMNITEQYHLI